MYTVEGDLLRGGSKAGQTAKAPNFPRKLRVTLKRTNSNGAVLKTKKFNLKVNKNTGDIKTKTVTIPEISLQPGDELSVSINPKGVDIKAGTLASISLALAPTGLQSTGAAIEAREEADLLIEEIDFQFASGRLNSGQARELKALLVAARGQLKEESDIRGVNEVLAFINKVQEFIGAGAITPREGGELIEDANIIVDDILSR
ncbi:MAG: hypothetical protein ACE5HV_11120 [Acidobacteriota bacterium]